MALYIVKTQNVDGITSASVVRDLGDGFFLVESDDPTTLQTQVENLEEVHSKVSLQSVINGVDYPAITADAQWPRLRVISRTYPRMTEFKVANAVFKNTPELFIVDSGINFDHEEFTGIEAQDFYKVPGLPSFRDADGHGTAIASTACGINVGVTTNVELKNVRVFASDYDTTLLELGDAFNAILIHHTQTPAVPKVVNCSWNIPKSAYIENRIQSLINAGVTVVGAAGNNAVDVAELTPASMTDVIVAAASDIDDIAAGFNNFAVADLPITTNHGLTVDLFAPGVDVVVAKWSGGYFQTSGTSLSAGFVSGAACAAAAMIDNLFGPALRALLVDYATKGALLLDSQKFTQEQNNLLYMLTGDEVLKFADAYYFIDTIDSTKSEITGNVAKVLSYQSYAQATGETFVLTPVFEDPAVEQAMAGHMTFDADGNVTITRPDLLFSDENRMQLISFKVNAVSSSITFSSPNILFIVVDPTFTGDLSNEISSSLENISAQSLFAAWALGQQIK